MEVIRKDYYKVPVFSWCPEIEEEALEQIDNVARLPFVKYAAVMSDAHKGYGVPIGSVVACDRVVVIGAVGVDIGCGVIAVKTSLKELNTDSVKAIMGNIRQRIPVGMNWHKTEIHRLVEPFEYGGELSFKELPVVESQLSKARLQLGTLGGGNHFVELQKGDDGYIWYMIHSGSRNLGKRIADHYTRIAKELNERWFSFVPIKWDLAFLPIEDENFSLYMAEMRYGVEFAAQNRKAMAVEVEEAITEVVGDVHFESPVHIEHNYAAWENHKGQNLIVHRKGATSAKKGQLGIIPGSQGTASYIVEGRGNEKSLNSCSHGAGRAMGRKQAQRDLDLQEEIDKLNKLGVVHGLRTTKDLDEASSAYKNIDEVMANQIDLVKIVTKLTPLGVIKG